MIAMREFNYVANFVLFLAPIWAVLSPRIPVKLMGHAVLFCLSISAIWNIEVTNTLQLSMSGLITKGSFAFICLWLFWKIEKEHLKVWSFGLVDQCRILFWWIK